MAVRDSDEVREGEVHPERKSHRNGRGQTGILITCLLGGIVTLPPHLALHQVRALNLNAADRTRSRTTAEGMKDD